MLQLVSVVDRPFTVDRLSTLSLRVAYGFLQTFVVNGGKIPPNSTKNIFGTT